MSALKKVSSGLAAVVLIAAGIVFYHLDTDRGDKYPTVDAGDARIPQFDEVAFPFSNEYDSENSLPIAASAIIDVDGDGVEEVFMGGGIGQADGLMKYENGAFRDISGEAGLQKDMTQTTIGAAVTDFDHDSRPDLLVSREGAVYFYKNLGGHFAASQNLNLVFDEKSEPASITLADLNRDGWADLFVSTYLKKHRMEGQTIFNKEGYGSVSRLFLNNGDNTFRDITREAGLEYVHNTFLAVFADLDGDGLEDLAVAHDTGEPRLYRNLGGLKFEMVPNPLTGLFSYPMCIAIADYDNDGLQDLFFSNVGKSLPSTLLRGDLREDQTLVTDWILLKNKGNFEFEDVAGSAHVANYEFAWGAVFEDFNLDGLQDLVVAENYVDLPNSRILPLP
ncbi:MAG: FG-GAP repeat domain-containing protein, partial [Saprospiraceae bacterium]